MATTDGPAKPALRAALLVLATWALHDSAAWACATCACGTPALTDVGNEELFAGRARAGLSMRAWSIAEGRTAFDTTHVREIRLNATALVAVSEAFSVQLDVPVALHEFTAVNLAREQAAGLGDVELVARFVVWRERKFQPRYVFSLSGGVRIPTALDVLDAQGQRLSHEAQLGSGSFTPLLSLGYAGFFTTEWSAFARVGAELPLDGRDGRLSPFAGTASAAAQYQPLEWLALRLGVESRLEGPSYESGKADVMSSGLAVFGGPDLLWRPTEDFTVLLGARLPLVSTAVASRPGFTLVASMVADL